MNIAFNYRYYTTPDHFETIALNFDTYVSKKVAYTLNDIGAVFALLKMNNQTDDT